MAVTLQSSRFGALEIPDEAVIEFPSGLIGLGGKRYALLARNGFDSTVCAEVSSEAIRDADDEMEVEPDQA